MPTLGGPDDLVHVKCICSSYENREPSVGMEDGP
jgi:hypothetical protein